MQEEGKDEEKRGRAAEETEAGRRTYPHRLGLTGKAETLIIAQAKVLSAERQLRYGKEVLKSPILVQGPASWPIIIIIIIIILAVFSHF